MSLSCASAIFHFLVTIVVQLLGPSGALLTWILLILFLCWVLGKWVWDDSNSMCQYMVLSLLVGFSVLCFCCPLWILEESGGCVLFEIESRPSF